MESVSDELLAQLMDMGFEREHILACQMSLTASGTPITIQSVAEWLLQQQQTGTGTTTTSHTPPAPPTLRLGGSSNTKKETENDPIVSDFSRPVSSGANFSSSSSQQVKSRLDFGDEKRRLQEQSIAKERDEAVKKARERRMADFRAKEVVRQQIAEDKQRRLERSRVGTTPTKSGSDVDKTIKQAPQSSSVDKSSLVSTCRVQIRLSDGSVLRHSFAPTSTLNEVCQYILSQRPQLTVVQLVQPFPHKEFTPKEHTCTLQDLGLCPSASLVISKQPTKIPDSSH